MDSEKLKQLLERAFTNVSPSTVIMADPQIVNELIREKSPLIVMKSPKPVKEELIDLYDIRKFAALEIVDKIPVILDKDRHSIQRLYDEIKECIYFGVNGAAITLCGVMVEYVLKYVVYHWDIAELTVEFNSEKWDCLEENTSLHNAIDKAKSLGIIKDCEAVNLIDYKETIRNPYNHYNIKKLVKNIVCPVQCVDLKTECVESKEILAEDDPAFYAIAKEWRDKQSVMPIFIQTYNVTRSLLYRLDEHWSNKNKI